MLHKGKYYVSFKRGFDDSKRNITITLDKVFESDSLKISLSDEEDPTFLCILSISRIDYEDLKKQQGLLVDFDNFPAQLIRLLQQCASNNMFLIMQQTNPLQYFLEVVEHNEFKRLVHLSLKACPATDSDIKQHMAQTIKCLKDSLSSTKSLATNHETALTNRCTSLEHKVKELMTTVAKMEEGKLKMETEFDRKLEHEKENLAQEILRLQRMNENNMKTQQSASQDVINRKEKQIDEINSYCKQLKDKLQEFEHQISEKTQRLKLIEAEVQKSHIEVATLKTRNTSLERDVAEKEKQINQQNVRCNYLEKVVKENNDTIRELTTSNQNIKKEKTSLEERLAISESLVNKNSEAIHITSEQLLKANQIISKQNADLIEMKEKLLCRTAIALEQEKVIERNTKEVDEMKNQINSTNQNMEKLNKEFESLKEKYETSEKALKDRDETIKNNNMVIQWLHKKLEDISPADEPQCSDRAFLQSAGSSTPYFISKNHRTENLSHGATDESIDFYATSKLSNVNDSPGPEVQGKTTKTGLDPKYLKPASGRNQVIKGTKTPADTQRGKENINVNNLPIVDYREKKSAKSSTYRATPVSAYFP